MELSRTLLLVVVVAAAAMSAAASAAEESGDAKPSGVMTPVAHTPVGSFEGADGPVADDATEDDDAAPVGSPIGTTMTEPKPELAPPAPPSSGATAVLVGSTAAAAAVAAAGIFVL